MKVFKPLIAFLVLLVTLSLVVGILFPNLSTYLSYSSTAYLLVCFGIAFHFLEEWYTKAWEVEAEIRNVSDERSGKPFLVLFSHILIVLSFLFYFPIAVGASWALIYGLGAALNSIMNGVAHLAILAKTRKNTGVISGLFLLITGLMVWISIWTPIL
ncbi:MAG: HXXEE domain-containing protein [Candidatus Thorarchaeota archaeon]|jgi:hypothetical protein